MFVEERIDLTLIQLVDSFRLLVTDTSRACISTSKLELFLIVSLYVRNAPLQLRGEELFVYSLR